MLQLWERLSFTVQLQHRGKHCDFRNWEVARFKNAMLDSKPINRQNLSVWQPLDRVFIRNARIIAANIRGWIVRATLPFTLTSSPLVRCFHQLCAFAQPLKCSWTMDLFGWLREEAELGLLGERTRVLRAAVQANDGGGNLPRAALLLFFVPFPIDVQKERSHYRIHSGRSRIIQQCSLPRAVFMQKETEQGTGALILLFIPLCLQHDNPLESNQQWQKTCTKSFIDLGRGCSCEASSHVGEKKNRIRPTLRIFPTLTSFYSEFTNAKST